MHSGAHKTETSLLRAFRGPNHTRGWHFRRVKREPRTWERRDTGRGSTGGDRPGPGRETEESRDKHALGWARHLEANTASGFGGACRCVGLAPQSQRDDG